MISARPCRPTLCRPLVLSILSLLLLLPSGARATGVWVTSSSEKVRSSAAARPLSPAALTAAKNEFEAFQIGVTADSGAIAGVTVTATALTGPGTIPAPRLFREELINLQYASSTDGATGSFPDALVPDVDDVVGEKRNAFPFDVPAGQTRMVWLEIHVPADAAPGVYQGSVTVSAGGASLATVPVTLTVWNFSLPSTSSLKSYFAIYYGDLPAQHGCSGDSFSALRARYSQLGLDHRISLGGFDDGATKDMSDAGTRAHFQQYFGPLVGGTAPTQLRGAQLTAVMFTGEPSQSSSYAAWASFAKANGFFDRLFDYTVDEPNSDGSKWAYAASRAQTAKQGDPAFRTLVTTTLDQAQAHGVDGLIDILVPVVNDGQRASAYGSFLAEGPRKELWMYQSCMSHGCDSSGPTGWPSYMIDTASLRSRAEEWLSFAWGATGELYWESTWAYETGDPWQDQWAFSGNGDGTLFYPGTPSRIGGSTHIPLASIRLKMIREGMEDFEYLKLLSDAGDPALAHSLAAQLFPDGQTEPSADDLLAARERIARRILELGGDTAASGASAIGAASAGSTETAASATGCSTAPGGEVLAGLGLLAALGMGRRRRR